MARDGRWSEAIAVGSLTFVDKVKNELGFKALHREFEPLGDSYALRERSEAYARQFAVETEALSSEILSRGMKGSKTPGT
jgi:REP-associated tyrosine transposase